MTLPSTRLPRLAATRDRLELWLLVLVAFGARAAFVYRHGMPEPDSVAMAAGMALGMSADVPVGDAVFYGRQVSPGMHVVAGRVFPALLGDPHLVVPFLNWMTAVISSLLIFPLYALIRKHVAHAPTIAALGVWSLTPIVWEAGTYYHPIVPATLLLALALVCAREISASVRGAFFFCLALVLSTASFIVRVEIASVWPAILVWTLTSNARSRNTGLLIVVSALVAAGYLAFSRLLSAETTLGAKGVVGYLETLSATYLNWFSLYGLPRSTTWMVLGLGVGSIAASGAAMVRRLRRNTAKSGSERLVAFALVWWLPPAIFWLLVPTPILRHYVLASIGLALLLGVVVLDRLSRRRVWIAAAIIATLNVAVPESLYRAYNARTSDRKTPNGSFFYFHAISADRIERNARLADRIVACSGPGSGDDSPRSCALVTWEGFAAIAYAAAVSGHRVEPKPIEMIFPGVRYVRLAVGTGELRLIHYVYFEDEVLRSRVLRIMEDSRANGYCLFAPRELRDRVPGLRALGNAIEPY